MIAKNKEAGVSGERLEARGESTLSASGAFDLREMHVPRRRFLQSFLAAGVLNAGPAGKLGELTLSEKTARVIDIHAHYYPVEYLELIDRFGGSETGTAISRNCLASQAPADLEFRFRVMEEAGIDLQVLSVPPQFPYFENEQHGVAAARLANDLCADLARQYPQKFEVFAIFPLPHMDASLQELSRGMDELGMVGAAIGTTVLGRSIADPAFDPLYAELERRRAILFIHPTGVSACSACITKSGLTWAVGAPFEDTVCLLQLMSAGIPKRFPNIKIIISHLGGTLPFLIRRLDLQAAQFISQRAEKPSALARSFWCDTVNGHPPALRDACDCYGTDKVLLGTDYPYWRNEMKLCVDFVKQIGLSASEVAAILGGTSTALLAPHLGRPAVKPTS
jgi:aminocarboxymuconate-semialdehyde decarboxylase